MFEKINITRKQDLFFLSIGVFLWVFGDLITTWYGFHVGLIESNSFFSNSTIYEMLFFKIIIISCVLVFFRIATKYNWHYLKIPIYTAMIAVGLFAVINNLYFIFYTTS